MKIFRHSRHLGGSEKQLRHRTKLEELDEFPPNFWDNIAMSKKPSWTWMVHFLIYFIVTALDAATFFDRESAINLYYHTLLAYDLFFLFPYSLNVLAVILMILTLVPFYCFLFQRPCLSKTFWRIFFAFRLAFDLTGRSYEFKFIKSIYYHDTTAGLNLTLLALLLFLPSYIALYLYAFRPRNPGR